MAVFYPAPPLPPLRLGSVVVTLRMPLVPQVTEDVTVGEQLHPLLLLFPAIPTEGLTLGETSLVGVPFLGLTVTEVTPLSDPVALLVPFLAPSLTDAVTVGDAPVVAVPFLAFLSVDALTMSDDLQMFSLVIVVPLWPQHQLSQAVHRAAHW